MAYKTIFITVHINSISLTEWPSNLWFALRRYIYGLEINFELSDLYDSYLAAETYVIDGFEGALFEYIRTRLNLANPAANIFLIYDQLVKIDTAEELLAQARTIIERSKVTFASEHFTQIGQETLISLLSLEELNIDEFDLFMAVSKWVDCEVRRQDLPMNRQSRRQVFWPIQGYILFNALTPDQVARCQEIDELLSLDEIGSLLLHLLNPDGHPYSLELRTTRRAGCITRSVSVRSTFSVHSTLLASGYLYASEVQLHVNRSVYLKTIHTTYSSGNAANLTLAIFEGFLPGYQPSFVRRVQASPVNGKCCFVFDPPFCLGPLYRRGYRLQVAGSGVMTEEDRLSKERVFNFEESVFFYLTPNSHFIERIDFEKINRF